MRISRVCCIKRRIKEEVTLKDIIMRDDYIKVKKNIFCAEENCEADTWRRPGKIKFDSQLL